MARGGGGRGGKGENVIYEIDVSQNRRDRGEWAGFIMMITWRSSVVRLFAHCLKCNDCLLISSVNHSEHGVPALLNKWHLNHLLTGMSVKNMCVLCLLTTYYLAFVVLHMIYGAKRQFYHYWWFHNGQIVSELLLYIIYFFIYEEYTWFIASTFAK